MAEPSSIVMRDLLVRLGVPESRILLESTSHNTHDEAVLIAPTLRSLNVEHLILVTSEVHMRRSIGAFRAQGWSAVPAIASIVQAYLRHPAHEELGVRFNQSLSSVLIDDFEVDGVEGLNDLS